MLTPLLLLVVAAAALVAGRETPRVVERATAALAGRAAPWIVGAMTGATWWWLAGASSPLPTVHDEASYLLQAQIFSMGRWTMPSPELPSFFEQFHVFVEPRFASKYPPGHALLLVPGVWLGAPFVVPALLNGVSGALVFALARRVANPWVALLTWVLWLLAPDNLRFRPRYYSEATSGMLWLAGWWSLLEWRRSRAARWLLLLAACTGWGIITRPLTMAAFALPVAIVVLRDIRARGGWRQLWASALLGAAIVMVLPLWSQITLGDWRTTPYSRYSAVYFPYDKPGFGADDAQPLRELPPDMKELGREVRARHAAYVPSALPHVLIDRAGEVIAGSVPEALRALVPFAVLGALVAGSAGAFAVVSAVALLLAYLAFAQPPGWSLYYLEVSMVVPFLAATGVWGVVLLARRRGWVGLDALRRDLRSPLPLAAAGLLLVAGLAALATPSLSAARRWQVAERRWHARVWGDAERLPETRAVIFVRYAPGHDPNASLIANQADLAHARLWWVYDRGEENDRLRALAPSRAAYLFDEASGSFRRLP